MEVRLIPVGELSLDPDNAREHPEHNLSAITESLRQFGFQKPIVVTPAGKILAGNGAYMAAVKLGMEAVPCSVSDIEDENMQKAFALADNRTQELSQFNEEILAKHLRELDEIGFDVESIGFDAPKESKPKKASIPDPDEITCPNCGHEFTDEP